MTLAFERLQLVGCHTSQQKLKKSRGATVPKTFSKYLARMDPKGYVLSLQVMKQGSVLTASQTGSRIRCGWVPETHNLLFFIQVSEVVSGFSAYSSFPIDLFWSTFSLRKQHSMPHTMCKATFTNLLILFRSSSQPKVYGNYFCSIVHDKANPTRPRSL